MSLEATFANLSIGEEASVVDAIKKDGVVKSGFADNIDVLVAKCDSNDDNEALAALATCKALAEGCPEAEAFNKECLTACKCFCEIHKLGPPVQCHRVSVVLSLLPM